MLITFLINWWVIKCICYSYFQIKFWCLFIKVTYVTLNWQLNNFKIKNQSNQKTTWYIFSIINVFSTQCKLSLYFAAIILQYNFRFSNMEKKLKFLLRHDLDSLVACGAEALSRSFMSVILIIIGSFLRHFNLELL